MSRFVDKIYSHSHSLTRRVVKMMCVFGSVEAMTMLCSLVRNKLIAVWVGAAGTGLLGLYSVVIEMITSSTQLGLRTSAVKEIASAKGNERMRTIVAARRLGLGVGVLGTVVTILLSPLLSLWTFDDYEHVWQFSALSAVIFLGAWTSAESAVLQGQEMLKRIARSSIWSVPLSLIISVPFIYLLRVDSIIPVIMIYSAVFAVALYFNRYRMPQLETPMSLAEIAGRVRRFVSLGFFLTVSGLGSWLASYVIMSFFNREGGESAMGMYQAGYTMAVRYVGIVFTVMGVEFYPRLTQAVVGGVRRASLLIDHQIKIVLWIITPMAVAMIFLAGEIVPLLYSKEFMPVVPLVILAAPGLALRGVSWCYSFVMLSKGDGLIYLIVDTLSSALSVVLCILGYRLWGYAGVGMAFSVWYAIYCVAVMMVTRIRYSLDSGWRAVLWTAVCTMLIGIAAVATMLF